MNPMFLLIFTCNLFPENMASRVYIYIYIYIYTSVTGLQS